MPLSIRALTVLLACVVGVAGCAGSNGLTEESRSAVGEALVLAADGAGLVLPTAGVACFADQIPDDLAEPVVADLSVDWTAETGAAVAAELVECVGAEELMAAELRALRPDLSDPSVECVSQRLDPEVVEQVIDAALRQRPRNGPAVEVELSVALGVCLRPDELLDL